MSFSTVKNPLKKGPLKKGPLRLFHKANQMLVGYFTTVIWKKMTILKIAFIFPPQASPYRSPAWPSTLFASCFLLHPTFQAFLANL